MDTFLSPMSYSLTSIGGISLLCLGAFFWASQSKQKLWYVFAVGFLLQLMAWVGSAVFTLINDAALYAMDHPWLHIAFVFLGVIGTWVSAIALLIIALVANQRPTN